MLNFSQAVFRYFNCSGRERAYTPKVWVEKNLLFEKIDIALEGERFVLGGCPSHHLLYS